MSQLLLNSWFSTQEDLLIHGDSVYDVIDKQDQQAVRSELSRAPADGEDRVFLCRMNVARNARRQMRFGDQKVMPYIERRNLYI